MLLDGKLRSHTEIVDFEPYSPPDRRHRLRHRVEGGRRGSSARSNGDQFPRNVDANRKTQWPENLRRTAAPVAEAASLHRHPLQQSMRTGGKAESCSCALRQRRRLRRQKLAKPAAKKPAPKKAAPQEKVRASKEEEQEEVSGGAVPCLLLYHYSHAETDSMGNARGSIVPAHRSRHRARSLCNRSSQRRPRISSTA